MTSKSSQKITPINLSQAQRDVLEELNSLYTDCESGAGKIVFMNRTNKENERSLPK